MKRKLLSRQSVVSVVAFMVGEKVFSHRQVSVQSSPSCLSILRSFYYDNYNGTLFSFLFHYRSGSLIWILQIEKNETAEPCRRIVFNSTSLLWNIPSPEHVHGKHSIIWNHVEVRVKYTRIGPTWTWLSTFLHVYARASAKFGQKMIVHEVFWGFGVGQSVIILSDVTS